MTSQVFYRKWRPSTFSQVVGQDHVTTTLRHAVVSGRVAHAYLFSGPRGTGKTSTGRILAKAVNCLAPGEGDACDRCAMCLAISEGRALDLVEIDGASNRGIEEARDLREKVRFAPYEAKFKVYIIDEVHMLTDPAFNALLKTLEEPPPYVIFILATTEPHKVPATILSRCQRFDFRRIAEPAVMQRLAQVCEQEGLELEPAALRLIARSAGGSLRDAENLLEQLVVGYGHRLSLPQVAEVLGTATDERSREVGRLLLRRDLSQALSLLNQAHEEGVDLRQFQRGLLDYLRSTMLLKAGAEAVVAQEAAMLAEMKALSQDVPVELLVRAVKAIAGVSISPEESSPLALELALAEVCLQADTRRAGPERGVTVSEDSRDKRQQDRAATGSARAPAPPRAPTTSPRVLEPPPREVGPAPVVGTPPPVVPTVAPPYKEPEAQPAVPLGTGPLEVLKVHWKQVIEAMRGKGKGSISLDALLRSSCVPLSLEDDTLVLGFSYPAHKDKMEMALEDPFLRKALEEALAQVVGRPLRVTCVLLQPKEQKAYREGAPGKPRGHLVREAQSLGARPAEEEKP
ncbi:MAG: DNA polymerase III subunit gamma/tau [Chloroflexi bacterium]|nr:DNA polymerase III subunit gamma/tau [Chloroflexota bacterium]